MKTPLLHWLILILIVFLGIFVRCYKLVEFTNWFGDASQNLIIAKHQAIDEFVWAYPEAYGAHNSIRNSSLYFTILTAAWKIFPSEIQIISLFAVLGVINIILAYCVGKSLHTSVTGLIAALLFATSSFFVETSRSIWQPFLLTPLTLLALLFTSQFQKTTRFYWSLLAIQVIFLGLHIHFAFLPLALFLFSWNLFLIFKNGFSKLDLVLFIELVGLNIVILINTTGLLSNPPTQESNPLNLLTNIYSYQVINHLKENFFLLSQNLVKISHPLIFLPILLILISLICLAYRNRNLVVFYLLGVNLSFIFTAWYKYEVVWHYFMPYYVVVLISYAFILSKIKFLLPKIVLFLIYVWLFSQQVWIYFTGLPPNEFYNYQTAANIIKTDLIKYPQQAFTIEGCNENDCNLWSGMGVWYFIEKHTEWLKIDNDKKNLTLKEKEPQLIYFICSNNSEACEQLANQKSRNVELISPLISNSINNLYIYRGFISQTI